MKCEGMLLEAFRNYCGEIPLCMYVCMHVLRHHKEMLKIQIKNGND